MNCCRCVLAALFLSWSLTSSAAQESPQTFELPLQGITIEADERGAWLRMFATGHQAVEFPDRRGISTAQKIAEERAKAEIIKFLQQKVSAETLVNEIEASSQIAARRQGTSGSATTRDTERRVATSVSETLRSSSQGVLRGVMVLEAGYSEQHEDAWVKVGVNRASLKIATEVQNAVANAGKGSVSPAQSGTAEPASGRDTDLVRLQPSEVRRDRSQAAQPFTQPLRGFTEARAFVRGLRLMSKAEWDAYAVSDDRPTDIPATPEIAYRERGWVSWENWLGIR